MAKINVDAAVSKSYSRGSMAAIARDESGRFLGASALAIEGITELEILEALAYREGMSLASDLLLRMVRLARDDCANVVRSIHEEAMGTHGQVVREIKARQADFQAFELVHEGRRFNVDAHRLARSALGQVLADMSGF
jgi:hypothetical protein